MSGVLFSLNRITNIARVLRSVSESEAQEAANVAEEYAKTHVQVATGQTRDSIHTEVNGNSVDLIADGASLFLEYGTVHMRAYPFMRPAMDAAEAQIGPGHMKATFESGIG